MGRGRGPSLAALDRRGRGAYEARHRLVAPLARRCRARREARLPSGSFVFVVSDFLDPVPTRRLGCGSAGAALGRDAGRRPGPRLGAVVSRRRRRRRPARRPGDGRVRGRLALAARGPRARAANEARLARLLELFRRIGFDPVLVGTAEPADIAERFHRWAERRRRSWRMTPEGRRDSQPVAVLVATPAAAAENVVVRATVDRQVVGLGDPFLYVVEVHGPSDSTVFAEPGPFVAAAPPQALRLRRRQGRPHRAGADLPRSGAARRTAGRGRVALPPVARGQRRRSDPRRAGDRSRSNRRVPETAVKESRARYRFDDTVRRRRGAVPPGGPRARAARRSLCVAAAALLVAPGASRRRPTDSRSTPPGRARARASPAARIGAATCSRPSARRRSTWRAPPATRGSDVAVSTRSASPGRSLRPAAAGGHRAGRPCRDHTRERLVNVIEVSDFKSFAASVRRSSLGAPRGSSCSRPRSPSPCPRRAHAAPRRRETLLPQGANGVVVARRLREHLVGHLRADRDDAGAAASRRAATLRPRSSSRTRPTRRCRRALRSRSCGRFERFFRISRPDHARIAAPAAAEPVDGAVQRRARGSRRGSRSRSTSSGATTCAAARDLLVSDLDDDAGRPREPDERRARLPELGHPAPGRGAEPVAGGRALLRAPAAATASRMVGAAAARRAPRRRTGRIPRGLIAALGILFARSCSAALLVHHGAHSGGGRHEAGRCRAAARRRSLATRRCRARRARRGVTRCWGDDRADCACVARPEIRRVRSLAVDDELARRRALRSFRVALHDRARLRQRRAPGRRDARPPRCALADVAAHGSAAAASQARHLLGILVVAGRARHRRGRRRRPRTLDVRGGDPARSRQRSPPSTTSSCCCAARARRRRGRGRAAAPARGARAARRRLRHAGAGVLTCLLH